MNTKSKKKLSKLGKSNLISTEHRLNNNNLVQGKMLKVFFHLNLAIKQSMRNKFNYNSREVQTIYPETRERGAATFPPIN